MSITDQRTEHHRIVVVGTGFAGLGAAIGLLRAGETDLVVLERAGEVGGTWRDNTYPGCACDIPSTLYSFSFAPNPDWSRFFPRQPEILDYLRGVARDFGVLPHIRFETGLEDAAWDDAAGVWRLRTTRGELTAQVLVVGAGPLSEPVLPDIPGLPDFAGPVFHSARWRHDVELEGKRVAVVGTGASAIQIVPEIAPVVAHLDVYQRTPPWVRPRLDRPVSDRERRLLRRFPLLQKAFRTLLYWALEVLGMGFTLDQRLLRPAEAEARRHLRRQVRDPALRERLTPRYAIGCKRITYSNDWYPALQRPNVDVVTEPITEIRPGGIACADGSVHPADVIVLATGFSATQPPAARCVRGADGRTLAEVWAADGMQAHLGTTVAGFPNLFFLVGPNTGLGHSSMVFVIESQMAYLVDAVRRLPAGASVDVKPSVQRAFNERLQRRMRRSVWLTGGCHSWYLDSHGRNSTLWPASTWRFRLRTRRFEPAEYAVRRHGGVRAPQPQDLRS